MYDAGSLEQMELKMKSTQEEIQAKRDFNEMLRGRYEAYFNLPAPVKLGDLKKALLGECQRVIDATPFGQEMTEADAAVMRLMTGWDYQHIRHMYNPKYFSDKRYIEVQYECGKWITHSWNKTIKPTTEWQDLQKAMREAVVPYAMSDYRKAAEPVCCHCGAVHDLSVDHKSKSFDEIMQTFVGLYKETHDGEWPAIMDGEMSQGRVLADEQVLADWIAYHDGVADFQILCRSCNASKGKKSLQQV